MRLFDKAIDAFQKSISINPNNAYEHNNLGTAFADLGHVNEAIYEYRAAIKLEAISLRWLFLLASLVGLLPLNEDFFGVCF